MQLQLHSPTTATTAISTTTNSCCHTVHRHQVLIRWALQHGTSVLPKSTTPARIKVSLSLSLSSPQIHSSKQSHSLFAYPSAMLSELHAGLDAQQIFREAWQPSHVNELTVIIMF